MLMQWTFEVRHADAGLAPTIWSPLQDNCKSGAIGQAIRLPPHGFIEMRQLYDIQWQEHQRDNLLLQNDSLISVVTQ